LALLGAPPAGSSQDFDAPEGFRVEKIAGAAQADDIFAMTLDGDGQVIVSGRGYIRRLRDRDEDGRLETVEEIYAGPENGCQGLLVVDETLYFVGGRGLEALTLSRGEGKGPSEPRLVLSLPTGGEHNSHALRRGPDGHLYLLLGNNVKLTAEQIRAEVSPVVDPYAGLLTRLSSDRRTVEVLAHGLRNAYDFDFLADGEIVTWDSDGERDEGLPWYRPARLYHLTPGADCGWRSTGSGKLPTYTLDAVAPVADVGRASPTGVVCYRHSGPGVEPAGSADAGVDANAGGGSFPARFQGGVFALDWTFGRILFFTLKPRGGTYDGELETFVSARGGAAFAPTDIEVAPDGSLVVTSGGRGLEGGIYRISYAQETPAPNEAPPLDPLAAVLRAPMPHAEWSRRRWEPLAAEIPSGTFLEKALSGKVLSERDGEQRLDGAERLRALDIFMTRTTAAGDEALRPVVTLASRLPTVVRARAAWWCGQRQAARSLRQFLMDRDPGVRRVAIESATRLFSSLAPGEARRLASAVGVAAANAPRRVRQAAAYALAQAPAEMFASVPELSPLAVAAVLRTPWGQLPHIDSLRAICARAGAEPDPQVRLDALRLLEITFERLQPARNPKAAFFESWREVDLTPFAETRDELAREITAWFDDKDGRVAVETSRVAAVLELDSLAPAVVGRLTVDSAPGQDLVTLSHLSRLRLPWASSLSDRVVEALIDMPFKVERLKIERDPRWHRFLGTIWNDLREAHPELVNGVLAAERFGHPDHTLLAEGLVDTALEQAVARFVERPLPSDRLTRQSLVAFLASHPTPAARRALRQVASDPSLRELVLGGLAKEAVEADRHLFVEALTLEERRLVAPALRGLEQLRLPPPTSRATEWLQLVRWGLLLDGDLSSVDLRDLVAGRLETLSGDDAGYATGAKGRPQQAAFERWGELFLAAHPDAGDELAAVHADLENATERLQALLTHAAKQPGDAERGGAVFERSGCGSCHRLQGTGGRAGPDLRGLGKRFSAEKILEAILFPHREVAPRYRSRVFVLRDGTVLEGLTAYSSRAATLLRTSDGRLHRLSEDRVAQRIETSRSFMPSGLLDGLTLAEVADLLSFLSRA